MGKTRPRHTDVALPRGKKTAAPTLARPIVAAMAEVRKAARQAAGLSATFWSDHKSDRLKSLETSRAEMREFKAAINQTDPLRPRGARMENEVHILHDQLDLAFGLAAGAVPNDARAQGAPFAAIAREVVLDEILYPYNRLYGQYKNPKDLRGLAARAGERFASRLATSSPSGPRRAVRLVFEDYVRAIEELRELGMHRSLADSRLMWLPFQLALRPEQHDSQQEIDAILSRAQRTPLIIRQPRLLLERAAVAADAASQHPRHPRLSRPVAPRLRRRRPRGRRRRDQLLHHGRGLPEGPHRARPRVRPHGNPARLHDPGRPQLLGSEQGPRVHRRPAGPAAGAAVTAEAGGRGEPEDAGGGPAGARGAARGGRGLEAPAGGSGAARSGLAAEVRVRAPERDEPGGLLLSHEPPPQLPADRAGHHRARPPQDHLLRRDRARPGQGRRHLRRRRRGRAIRLRHLGGPLDPAGGPGRSQRQGRDPPVPQAERVPGRGHPAPAAAHSEARRLRRTREGAGGPGLDRHGDGGAQRPGLRPEGRERRVRRALHADAARQPDRRPRFDLDARAVGGAAVRCRAAGLPRLRDRPGRGERAVGGLPPAVADARDLEPLPRGPADPRSRDRRSRRPPARGPLHADERRRRPAGAPRGDAPDVRALPVPEGGLPVPRGLLRERRRGRGAPGLDRLPARRRPPAGGRARPLSQAAPQDPALRHERRAGGDRARPADAGRHPQPDALHGQAGDRLRARGAGEGPHRPAGDLQPLPRRRARPAARPCARRPSST